MKACTVVILSLFLSSNAFALPGGIDPERVDIAAKFAKQKAKSRAFQSFDDFRFEHQVGGDGCDVNIGNVIIDEPAFDAPDEVIVIIEGDVIQANNCRSF